jgi:hypothetical protein
MELKVGELHEVSFDSNSILPQLDPGNILQALLMFDQMHCDDLELDHSYFDRTVGLVDIHKEVAESEVVEDKRTRLQLRWKVKWQNVEPS